MMATFLKTSDGNFAYGPAFGAILFLWLASWTVWTLIKGLKIGKLPFGYAGKMGSNFTSIDRAKNSIGFWAVFFIWACLFLPFCIFTVYALCTGFFLKLSSN
jgi:hypothetical protein